jgi:two-component system LytT family response regulator
MSARDPRSSKIRVLVVDDEPPARSKIVRLLANDARFELAGEAKDGRDAVEKVAALAPDLMILDIQMPGLTGFEVVEAIGADACPRIIFSTAYDAFALKAFDLHAIDYLLKPYDAARFAKALDHAALQLTRGAHDAHTLRALLAGLHEASAAPDRLLVKTGESLVPIALDGVSHIRAEGKYVRIHTAVGQEVVREPLKSIEQRLDPKRFVRIHRGDLVNLDFVARLEPSAHGDGIVVMKDGSALVLSRNHRDEFLKRWGGASG